MKVKIMFCKNIFSYIYDKKKRRGLIFRVVIFDFVKEFINVEVMFFSL